MICYNLIILCLICLYEQTVCIVVRAYKCILFVFVSDCLLFVCCSCCILFFIHQTHLHGHDALVVRQTYAGDTTYAHILLYLYGNLCDVMIPQHISSARPPLSLYYIVLLLVVASIPAFCI